MTEMLQKTENVVKNVANENSQDLTSQWKKGELPSGWYYVRLIRGEYRIYLYINGKKEWIDCPDNIIDAVVRKVPSYEVYKDLIDGRKLLREYIKDTTNENAKLKEYKRIVTSYNMKPIDYDIDCETVNKLLDDNKRLKHDVGNLGYKIKNQRHEIDNRLKEIEKLKELLKECFIAINEGSFWDECEVLHKIEQALGEDK